MKNIKKLILKNFQQWKSGEIEFKNGLNILIGNTECGKSTLFRAIGSILNGKMPEDYIRKGSKECEVKVEFSDGSIFRRVRGKNNIADANGIIFERVGKDIPFEYFKQLGPTSIKFGNKDLSLCYYSQFEPHFFITLSDYDKSKLIGTICGIDIIDKIIDGINKDIRNNNINIKFLNSEIEKQKAEKESKTPIFNNLEQKLSNLSIIFDNAQNKFKTLTELSDLHQKMTEYNNNIISLQNESKALEMIDIDKSKISLLDKLYDYRNKLNQLKSEINNLNSKKLNIKDIDFEKSKFLYKLVFVKNKISEYNKQIKEQNNLKEKTEELLSLLVKQKAELLKDYDRCPLCGGIL